MSARPGSVRRVSREHPCRDLKIRAGSSLIAWLPQLRTAPRGSARWDWCVQSCRRLAKLGRAPIYDEGVATGDFRVHQSRGAIEEQKQKQR